MSNEEDPDWVLLNRPPPRKAPGPGPVGLKGWLILPLLYLLMKAATAIFVFYLALQIALNNWEALTLLQKITASFQTGMGLVLQFVTPIALLFLAFKRLTIFPDYYKIWACALPLWVMVDGLITQVVFPDALNQNDSFWSARAIHAAYAAAHAALAIAYMDKSARVANTFTK